MDSIFNIPVSAAAYSHTHAESDVVNLTTDLAGKHTYVDRGDAEADDFTNTDLTLDNDNHDLSLAALIPAGAFFCEYQVTDESRGD